jgi:biopolymer transport protein ExbD
MITRPLDLSTRLRPPPRSYDYLFWVNGALIALFFTLFGSRFVLSPGMGVGRTSDLLPVLDNAVEGAVATQLTVNVTQAGQLYVDTGFVSFDQFKLWLEGQARANPGAVLLVHFNVRNPADLLVRITNAANAAGVRVLVSAVERQEDVNALGAE